MSRLAKSPIEIPKGTEVKIEKGKVHAKGAKGTLEMEMSHGIIAEAKDGNITVKLDEEALNVPKAFLGLNWALLRNVVEGVSKGFEKKLILIGVGFRAAVQGTKLDVKVGFSHPTIIEIPKGITVKVEKGTEIIISGADKQQVGQFAAQVRILRKPEPYKGKGIRYHDEYVRRKAGKAAKGGK